MISVPVPKDLAKVRTKILFNLTKRQLICFSTGALVGLPLYFALREPVGNSGAAMCMILAMLPFFLLAMYEKNGRPLERILRDVISVCFLRPKQRPYKTNTVYTALRHRYELEQEVRSIVGCTQKKTEKAVSLSSAGGHQTDTCPAQENPEGDPDSRKPDSRRTHGAGNHPL